MRHLAIPCILGVGLLTALTLNPGCSDDDQSSGELTFKGQQQALPNYSKDTGYLPAGSPAQVKLELSSGGEVTVEAAGTASGDTLTGKPGSGKLTMAVQIKFQVKLKVAVPGIKYDGPLKNAPDLNIKFGGTTTFDPFSLDKPVTLDTKVPETKLATIPLAAALGIPGVTGDLELTVSGTLTTAFSGVCAKAQGGAAQYTGKTVTSGTLIVKPTLKLKAFAYSKTVGPFDVPVTIPSITSQMDLGTVSISGGTPPAKGPCSGTAGDGGVGDGGVGDGPGNQDATGPGTCNPSSGQPEEATCKLSSECKCPSICVVLFDKVPGSCWTQCDPAKTNKTTGQNPACDSSGSGEACWGYGCMPLGTLSGSFTEIPVYTYPDVPADSSGLGATTLEVNLPKVGKVTFDLGFGTTVAGSPNYSHVFVFWPVASGGTALDQTRQLEIYVSKQAAYKAGASFDLKKVDLVDMRYSELTIDTSSKVTKQQLRAITWDGTLSFTKAGSGNKAPATGSVTGRMAHYEATICGPGVGSCQ